MHIPNPLEKRSPVLSFKEALAQSMEPVHDYDPGQWLYVPCAYTDYRYILGTRGQRPLICVGINPSTAAPNALDNTLCSVQRVALHNGYDSFIMFNVCAQRATRPQDMDRDCDPYLHQENMAAFRYILSLSTETPAIWAAWGTIIQTRSYLPRCVEEMIAIGEEYGAKWFTAGARSKKGGHPHHPLYLKKDSPLDPFDPQAYLESLTGKVTATV
ncbi:DUF1643 domain-containing protein [Angelakisella massiliensis]|uniref:DUF1643 domain-containing protein n=1 Tax=Angelakisella massiliensis TaxID=1871018 RepID=UPI0023A8F8EC|nr:DUF1643 domain-containing protein [Angelakisella massiliensis]